VAEAPSPFWLPDPDRTMIYRKLLIRCRSVQANALVEINRYGYRLSDLAEFAGFSIGAKSAVQLTGTGGKIPSFPSCGRITANLK